MHTDIGRNVEGLVITLKPSTGGWSFTSYVHDPLSGHHERKDEARDIHVCLGEVDL